MSQRARFPSFLQPSFINSFCAHLHPIHSGTSPVLEMWIATQCEMSCASAGLPHLGHALPVASQWFWGRRPCKWGRGVQYTGLQLSLPTCEQAQLHPEFKTDDREGHWVISFSLILFTGYKNCLNVIIENNLGSTERFCFVLLKAEDKSIIIRVLPSRGNHY